MINDLDNDSVIIFKPCNYDKSKENWFLV